MDVGGSLIVMLNVCTRSMSTKLELPKEEIGLPLRTDFVPMSTGKSHVISSRHGFGILSTNGTRMDHMVNGMQN